MSKDFKQLTCFDHEGHVKYYRDLQIAAMELMSKGLCPNCKQPIAKHRSIKSRLCEKMIREKLQLRSFMSVDGKLVEITSRAATDEEIKQARENKND